MSTPGAPDARIETSEARRAAQRDRLDAILLTTDFYPQVGGVSAYLGGLWREAANWGRAAVYSTLEGGERYHEPLRVLAQPPDRRLGARMGDRVPLTRRLNTLAHFAALRRYTKRTIAPALAEVNERSRVCVGIWSPLAHFWCEALDAAKHPYALFAYGLDVIQPLYPTIVPWRARDFRRAARVIACSSGTAAVVADQMGVEPARLRVVHPGIDVSGHAAPAAEEVARLRSALGLTSGPIILSVGRLVRRKGFDVALRAFAAYRAGRDRGEYVIAGEGPERAALESLATELGVRDHVHFAGAVDEPTKMILYELCDVFMMPNSLLNNMDWEGFGIVFLEAARAGKPSIGGNNGGVPDAIVDDVTGRLVDAADERQVADALTGLLDDEPRRIRLGAAARVRAAASFDWPVIGEQFRGVLEESW